MPRSTTARLVVLIVSMGLPVASRVDGEGLLPDTAWEEPIAIGLQAAPINFVGMAGPAPRAFGQQPMAPPTQYVLPPPQAAPDYVPPPPVNGTWRDDGQYVIIEVNGQQLRLLKSALAQPPAPSPGQIQVPTGTVHGRLLQRGRPLVNCQIVIVPMHKDGATDDNGFRQPVAAVTDADGIYVFANVPVGAYKLTWLPAGATQWIRRIEMKPDVFVHEGQDTMVKDLRMALQTIN
jgi:hypothetical protein